MNEVKRNTNPEGKCELCGEVLTKRKAAAHLKKCRAAKPSPEGKGRTVFYTFEATTPGLPEFFLFVELDGNKTLAALDGFLRDIWLECCGHCSAFTIAGVHYNSHGMGDGADDDAEDDMDFGFGGGKTKSMAVKINALFGSPDLFYKDAKFDYEYDFGTTSYVKLRVVGIRESGEKAPSKPVLLMRNLPPRWVCRECGKPATIVCSSNWGLAPDNVYCAGCAKKKLDDYERSPILNSPRSGLCGYC